MPLVFTRDEIREYLSEMGFGDLNEEDLNKFVQDLRKLIKVESRKRRRKRLGHTGHTQSDISSTTDEATVNSTNSRGYNDDNVENNISTDQQQQRRSQPTATTSMDQSHPQLLYTPKSRLPKTSRHLNNTTSSEYSTTSNSTPHSHTSTASTTTTSNGRYQPDSSRGEMSSSFKNSTTPTTFTTTTTTTTTDSTGVSETPYFEEEHNVKIRVHRVPLGEDNKTNRQKQKPQTLKETSTVVDGRGIRQEKEGKKAPSKVVGERENTKVFSRQPIEPEDELISHPGFATEDVHSDKSSSSSSSDSLSDADLLRLMEHILKGDITLKSGETSEAGDTGNKRLEIPPKIRRDPVALYHWYKTFWDRQKAPGEDRHMQLRWNVRAGTVGKYPCDADGVKINYLPLNPIKHKKKICAF